MNPLQRILPRPFIVKGKRRGCTECQKLRYIAEIRNRDILQRTAFTEQTGVYAAVIFKAPCNGNTGQAPAVRERVHIQALYIAVQHQLRDICALEGRLTDQADGCIDLALQTGTGKRIIVNILQVRQFTPVDGKRAFVSVKRLIEQLHRLLRQGKLPLGVPAGTQTEPVLAIARAVQHFRAADIYNIVARYAGLLIEVCPVRTVAAPPGRGIQHRCRCSRADRILAHIDGRRVGRDKVQRGTVIKRRIADRRLFFRINHDALQIGAAVKRLCTDIGQRFRQKRPLQLLAACKRTVRQCGHRQRAAVCSLNRAVKLGCIRVTDHQHNLRAALVRVVGLAPAVGLQDDCLHIGITCLVKLRLHVLSLCLQRAQNGIYIAVFKAVRGDGDLVSAHRQHNIFDILCVRKRLRTDGVDAARQSIIPGLCLHTGERFDLALGVVLQISAIVCFPPAVRRCNARTRAIQRSFVTAHKSVICVRLHNNNAAVHTAEVDFRQVAGSFRLQDQSGHLCCVRQRHLLYIFRNGQLGHVIRNAEVRTAVRIGKNTVRSCGIRRAVCIHDIALPDRDALYGCLCAFRLFAVVFRVDILHRIRNFDVINLMQGVFRAHIHRLHILRYLEHTAGIALIAGKRLHVNGFLGRRKLRYADRQIRLGLIQKSRCKTVFCIALRTGYRAGIRVIPADFDLHRIVIRQRNHIRRLDNMTARRRMIHPRNQPAVLLPAGEQRGQTFLSQQTSLIAVQVDYLALIIRIKAGVSIWIEKNIVVKLCIFIVFRQPAVEDEDAVSLQRVGNIRVVLPCASCTEAVRRTDFDLGRIARNLIQSLIIFSGCLIKEAEEGIADPDAVNTDEHAEMHIVAVCILQVAPVVKIAAVLIYIYIGFQGVINLASRDVFLTGVQRRRVCISQTILRLLNNNLRGRAVLYLSFIIRRTSLIVLTNQTGTGLSGFRILHGIRNGAALYGWRGSRAAAIRIVRTAAARLARLIIIPRPARRRRLPRGIRRIGLCRGCRAAIAARIFSRAGAAVSGHNGSRAARSAADDDIRAAAVIRHVVYGIAGAARRHARVRRAARNRERVGEILLHALALEHEIRTAVVLRAAGIVRAAVLLPKLAVVLFCRAVAALYVLIVVKMHLIGIEAAFRIRGVKMIARAVRRNAQNRARCQRCGGCCTEYGFGQYCPRQQNLIQLSHQFPLSLLCRNLPILRCSA